MDHLNHLVISLDMKVDVHCLLILIPNIATQSDETQSYWLTKDIQDICLLLKTLKVKILQTGYVLDVHFHQWWE